jgi:hypothetical protein
MMQAGVENFRGNYQDLLCLAGTLSLYTTNGHNLNILLYSILDAGYRGNYQDLLCLAGTLSLYTTNGHNLNILLYSILDAGYSINALIQHRVSSIIKK